MFEIDASLRRLGTDYVASIRFIAGIKIRPIEETLEALHDVDQSGKARLYWRLVNVRLAVCKGAVCSRQKGLDTFVSMQNHYNLLNREEERG